MANEPSILERGLVLHTDPSQRAPDNQKVLDRLALLVGLVAFGLPIALAIGATIGGSCFRDSISHFYHAQFLGSVFVGLLFFIGGFLIAYSGDHWLETWGSTIAGLCALGVALFPTAGGGCEIMETFLSRTFVEVANPTSASGVYTIVKETAEGESLFQLFGKASEYHFTAAAGVFIYLGLYCLVVLRRVIPERHGVGADMIATKRRRNKLYFWCAIAIFLCVALLGLRGTLGIDEVAWNLWNGTFFVETVALWAFALAWFTKGRIFESMND